MTHRKCCGVPSRSSADWRPDLLEAPEESVALSSHPRTRRRRAAARRRDPPPILASGLLRGRASISPPQFVRADDGDDDGGSTCYRTQPRARFGREPKATSIDETASSQSGRASFDGPNVPAISSDARPWRSAHTSFTTESRVRPTTFFFAIARSIASWTRTRPPRARAFARERRETRHRTTDDERIEVRVLERGVAIGMRQSEQLGDRIVVARHLEVALRQRVGHLQVHRWTSSACRTPGSGARVTQRSVRVERVP